MRKLFSKLALLTLCLTATSCATMTRWLDDSDKKKRMYTVTINSKTPGLQVYYTENGEERLAGLTPCTIYSDKSKIRYVTVKNGEVYQTVKLKCRDRRSTYWNFAPYYTFIWGYAVDKASGRSRIYSQKEYYVDL